MNEAGTGKSRSKYQVKYLGGPLDGQIHEEESPGQYVIPKGTDLDQLNALLEGKKPKGMRLYVFNPIRRTYHWATIK
jgi:hypothetical protein